VLQQVHPVKLGPWAMEQTAVSASIASADSHAMLAAIPSLHPSSTKELPYGMVVLWFWTSETLVC
jgi:hypothetical protein